MWRVNTDGLLSSVSMCRGFVAKFWEEATQARKPFKRESGLGGESEQLADEVSLADRISFGQPSHLALPDHVHCLDSLQCPPRTLKGSIALGQPNSFFNRPVVLFNHVIEVLALPEGDAAGVVPSQFSASPAARL